jgi:cytochrome c1
MVGPPLDHRSRRRYVAGHPENTPERLVTWITVPQAVDPGHTVPNMGVTGAQARAMAAYLYT